MSLRWTRNKLLAHAGGVKVMIKSRKTSQVTKIVVLLMGVTLFSSSIILLVEPKLFEFIFIIELNAVRYFTAGILLFFSVFIFILSYMQTDNEVSAEEIRFNDNFRIKYQNHFIKSSVKAVGWFMLFSLSALTLVIYYDLSIVYILIPAILYSIINHQVVPLFTKTECPQCSKKELMCRISFGQGFGFAEYNCRKCGFIFNWSTGKQND